MQYDIALPFSEGLAVVRAGKKYGFINKQAKEVIPWLWCKMYDMLSLQNCVA